ncbi:MAG TPA: phosphoribosylformylglycinamidine synthase subunit PurL [Ktedonobacteraceae bacterium]|nr:phosphoribosylformylglycinamidine synthase subunit PurL [Ktedonobacteraceae bacterium]
MTGYQIEIRAIDERHDAQAHRLVREILQLPLNHLPSLAAILDAHHPTAPSSPPFHLSTAHLYRLIGNVSDSQIEQLTRQLLVNPVVQEVHTSDYPAEAHVVDVFFHPGVTDTLAESVLAGAQMLGITGLERVETGQRYVLDERLSEADVQTIAQALLYNPVIQDYELHKGHVGAHFIAPSTSLYSVAEGAMGEGAIKCAPTSVMTDEHLMELSRKGLLSLNLEEMRAIQRHYREQGREPTDVELETLAQTWSEHCSHKTFRATIQYREIDGNGNVLETEVIAGLLKRYLMQATEQVRAEWLVSAFSDNAGIIRFTEQYDVAFKVETHNHPSAIEPFGGANTGVGGVIRDVLGVSAQPIACTDVLCFGPLDTPTDELPVGVLPPRRIASGVVNGVRDYGNKMGIPTVNGALLYHPGYIYNPLVFCGCLGILPHGSHPNRVQPGDRIVVLGGRTGRDGVHGATFSSGEMSREIQAQAGAAVQIGAPITEKKVTDVILQARDRQLYSAITDCGAGGFSSAIGEMAAKTGARVELAHAPLKYQGLTPWEIWVSEAQERMVLAVPPRHVDELLSICAIEEVEASILGTFTDDHRLLVTYHGQTVADMDMAFLHDGRPERTLEAVWQRNTRNGEMEWVAPEGAWRDEIANTTHYTPALLALLRHPTITSKEAVVRRYDFEVQGATVLKPLVGRAGNGPGNAAVLQPILDEQARAGIILSNGINPLYGKIDPYHMAINAVDEALRNLTAVGGDITRAAILDNFCWGNPTDPVQLGMLVRAVKGCHDAAIGFKVPFISGKDSLNNEYRSHEQRFPVIPTLLISAVGRIDDAAQTIDMSLKTPGNLLYQIGMTRNELAGSHYAEVVDVASFERLFSHTSVPQVNIARATTTMRALGEAIRKGLVRACHDLSEGGLAIAAAEMALAGMLGVNLNIHSIQPAGSPLIQDAVETVRLFSESASRFLVEVTPEQWGAFEKHMRTRGVQDVIFVGTVTNTGQFIVRDDEIELIHLSVEELQEAWRGGNI